MILVAWGSGEASIELTDRALWSEIKIMKKLPAIQAPRIKLAIRRVCTCFSVPWHRRGSVSGARWRRGRGAREISVASRSLLAKRHQRIDLRGTAGGNVASGQCDQPQNHGYRSVSERIGRLNFVEE